MFKDRPLHNYASHSADAFRYFAVAWRDKREKGLNQQAVMKQEWSVF
jgi:hypothetical protein